MKILFIGSIGIGQTSAMRMDVLRQLGHDVRGIDSWHPWNGISRAARRLQQHLSRGPVISRLNRDVIASAREFHPNLVWAEKQEYLGPETFRDLQRLGARLLHYTPDPYFTLSWKRTRLMDESLPLFDYLVTSKRYELDHYTRYPAKIIYVPLGFGRTEHRPTAPANEVSFGRFSSDVSFVGGWEPRREALLASLAGNSGIRLKVWGYGWDHLADGRRTLRRFLAMRRNAGTETFTIRKNATLASCIQGGEVYGDEYAWAISAARIGVGFLRRICPDQHTTRTFEIPACGSMLLADRTDEHQEFFREGAEAEFFDSEDELLDKARYYAVNESQRWKIASGGFERCHRSGYSYVDRVSEILNHVST